MGRLEWNRRVERERDVLERMLALLLALAALVDRAAGLPAARRLHLLAILGYGEAEARDFIIALASEAGASARFDAAPDAAAVTPIHEVGDAALLAARFRMLALVLGAMLMQARERSPCRHASPAASREPRLTSQNTPSPALRATSPPMVGRGYAVSTTMFFPRTEPRRAGRHWRCSPRAAGEVARLPPRTPGRHGDRWIFAGRAHRQGAGKARSIDTWREPTSRGGSTTTP